MVNYDPMHDFGSKTLLNGYVAPPTFPPSPDLNAALDNIASHPNVAPFISKQLIQHLVKSNPIPGLCDARGPGLHAEQWRHADGRHRDSARPGSARQRCRWKRSCPPTGTAGTGAIHSRALSAHSAAR